ncbi:MAG: aldehyde ferredoxin oxidoreductase N-terminal domain-containing protein, partial [Desulfotomaculales bacterium]
MFKSENGYKRNCFRRRKEEHALYGGRGLIAKIMNDEVNPKCDPLGPENKLILCRVVYFKNRQR